MSCSTPVSEQVLEGAGQLRLALFQDQPWDGRSPRALTRGPGSHIFEAQAEKSVSDFVSDENQYDLWLTIKKAPWNYQGASLLVPFDRGG